MYSGYRTVAKEKRGQHGFTLIEVMIVVAIVAILASIAYPAYQEQVRSSRRADCAGVLTSLATAMERHYTQFNSYCGAGTAADGDCVGGGDTGAPTVFSTQCPLDGGAATYNLVINDVAPNTFDVRAVPIAGGPQATDRCGTLTLNQTGQKGIVGAVAGLTPADCW